MGQKKRFKIKKQQRWKRRIAAKKCRGDSRSAPTTVAEAPGESAGE